MSKTNYIAAVLKLFNSYPSDGVIRNEYDDQMIKNLTKNSIVLDSKAVKAGIDKETCDIIIDTVGIDIMNYSKSSFYGNFKYHFDMSIEEKIINQLFHYVTAALSDIDLIEKKDIYVPIHVDEEKNEITARLKVISSLTDEEIAIRCRNLLYSGVALSSGTLENIFTIFDYIHFEYDLDEIKNKEAKVRFEAKFNIIPKNPIEFLRLAVFIKTDSTLLIKSSGAISAIKSHKLNEVYNLFKNYYKKYGYENLAAIFLRYKPLFLALKSEPAMKSIINKLRKLAVKYHKTKEVQILDTLTFNDNIDIETIEKELKKITVFKKISILNALSNKIKNPKNTIYFIRNNKTYVKTNEEENSFSHVCSITPNIYIVLSSILDDIKENFKNKKFFLPDNIEYAVPTSEKKMFGPIPFGSKIKLVDGNIIVGIHWYNTVNQYNHEIRTDLDLHVTNMTKDYGWNTYFHNANDNSVIYSGDMINAPLDNGGATEAFFIGKDIKDTTLKIDVNKYSGDSIVPFKFFVGKIKEANSIKNRNYLLNAHETELVLDTEIDSGHKFVGFIKAEKDETKTVYISEGNLGNSIVASGGERSQNAIDAAISRYDTYLTFKQLIHFAGGIIVNTPAEADIDLSLENLNKDTLLSLLTAEKKS